MKKGSDTKRTAIEAICVFGGFGAIITLLVLWRNWSSGVYDGTFLDELVPALLLGCLVGYAVLLIVSNIFKHNSGLWFVLAGTAVAITIAYKLLHLNETVGMVLLIILVCLLLLMVLIKWIANST